MSEPNIERKFFFCLSKCIVAATLIFNQRIFQGYENTWLTRAYGVPNRKKIIFFSTACWYATSLLCYALRTLPYIRNAIDWWYVWEIGISWIYWFTFAIHQKIVCVFIGMFLMCDRFNGMLFQRCTHHILGDSHIII